MAVKERSQIKGTDAQIKAFAGHNGVLAFATDTKSLHVLSGTAGTTTEFLPSTKVATKTELASYATKAELGSYATSETLTTELAKKANTADVNASFANYTPTASLATVATSGSYNDLLDKPSVDSALSSTSENPVQNKVVKSALDGKLSTSGGTMTGDISLNASVAKLLKADKNGSLVLSGGNHDSSGGAGSAILWLGGGDDSSPFNSPGVFSLEASKGTWGQPGFSSHELRGKPDGSLTWSGHNVISVVAESYGGNSWYRKYSDGWIEQGGRTDFTANETNLSITLPVAFSKAEYTITFCTNTDYLAWLSYIGTTNFTVSRAKSTKDMGVWWYACGK